MPLPRPIDPSFALLCCWDMLYQREQGLHRDQVVWDVVALPLLFGPTAIQDNMLTTPGVFDALSKYAGLSDIMRRYAQEGVLCLWQRAGFGPRSLPVNTIYDVVSDFARRAPSGTPGFKSVDTFDVGFFEEAESAQIREELTAEYARHTGKDLHEIELALDAVVFRHIREKRDDFDKHVRELSAVFFPYFTYGWHSSIQPLPCRLLSSMGVSPETVRMLEENPGSDPHTLAETILTDFDMNRPLKMAEWRPFVESAMGGDGDALAFFDFMQGKMAKRLDPGLVHLKNAARNAMPDHLKLATSIHICYMCGYSDAHDAPAIVPWFYPATPDSRQPAPPPPPLEPSPDQFLARLKTEKDLQDIVASSKHLRGELENMTAEERERKLTSRLRAVTKALYDVDVESLPRYFRVAAKALSTLAGGAAAAAAAAGITLVAGVLPDSLPLASGVSLLGGMSLGYKHSDRILAWSAPLFFREQALGWHAGQFFRWGQYQIENLNPGYGRQRRRAL